MPSHALTSDDGLKDAARSTLRELLSVSKRYRGRRKRLDALFLFGPRAYKRGRKTEQVEKSQVDWNDCPEMELMLKHRDCYDSMEATIVAAREGMKNAQPDDMLTLRDCLALIARLESQRDKHLVAIQEILGNLSRELMAQENVLAKVVAEGAKLASLAQLSRERIVAQENASGKGIESRSNTELTKIAEEMKKRLASGKYVPEEEDAAEEDEV